MRRPMALAILATVMLSLGCGGAEDEPIGLTSPTPTTSPSPSVPTTGQVLFWMSADLGQIEVRLNTSLAGTITQYYPNTTPSCGAAGSVTVTLPVGANDSDTAT